MVVGPFRLFGIAVHPVEVEKEKTEQGYCQKTEDQDRDLRLVCRTELLIQSRLLELKKGLC
jgi:hypothetical protein